MVHGEGPGIQQALIDTGSHAGVAGQEGSQRQQCLGHAALLCLGSLPACMGTGPGSWTEGLELGLGRVFTLLG